jgi:hypothetical protein
MQGHQSSSANISNDSVPLRCFEIWQLMAITLHHSTHNAIGGRAMRLTGILAVSLLSAAVAFPKDNVETPPQAPLPELMLKARTVMVTSEAGALVYDEAYKCLRKWGRFELTTEKSQADLMIVPQWSESIRPPRVRDVLPPYPFPYPYPYPYPMPTTRQDLWLVIVDSRTDRLLWTDWQFVRWAVREKNRKKDLILAVDALFKRLEERFPKK